MVNPLTTNNPQSTTPNILQQNHLARLCRLEERKGPLLVHWLDLLDVEVSSDQLVSLTDVFATCAEVIGADLPDKGAADSISFLASALGKPQRQGRTALVSHSNFGEFAYREGPWKLVYRLSGGDLEESRGKPTTPELYNLEADVAEQRDLADQRPEITRKMQEQLDRLITRGASRPGQSGANDGIVRYYVTQTVRWVQPAE